MTLTRKSLLARGAGLALGAAAVPSAAAQLDPRSWASVRAQFDARAGSPPHWRASSSPRTRAGARGDRAPPPRARRRSRRLPPRAPRPRSRPPCARRRRRTSARPPTDVALTDSTTMGLGLLYGGLDSRAGRGDPDDDARLLRHARGASACARREPARPSARCALYRDPARATADEIVASLARAVTPRTRVVAITWVHSSTGVKLPRARDRARRSAARAAGRACSASTACTGSASRT